ncbi:hypothetical protein D3C80_1904090 [compost metagenome]
MVLSTAGCTSFRAYSTPGSRHPMLQGRPVAPLNTPTPKAAPLASRVWLLSPIENAVCPIRPAAGPLTRAAPGIFSASCQAMILPLALASEYQYPE